MTIAIGLEGSVNKIGVGIVKDGEVLSNPRASYRVPRGEAIPPQETAQHHQQHVLDLVDKAMKEANVTPDQIDVVCYTKGPGIAAPLISVAIVARTLSQLWKKPIVGVNHCIGHIEMGRTVTKADNPTVLYVSGSNTQVIAYSAASKRYQVFGETIDIGIIDFLDQFARMLGVSTNPCAGHNIEKEAKNGNKLAPFPYIVKGMDVSFSGILSTVDEKAKAWLTSGEFTVGDLCFSLQEVVFSMLVEATERAMAHTQSKDILVVGGVGSNLRLQEMLQIMAEGRGGKLHAADDRYFSDNGAMIAQAGALMFESGQITPWEETEINERFRTNEVRVTWK